MFTSLSKSKTLLRFFALVIILVSLLGARNTLFARAQSGTEEDGNTPVQSPILEPATDPQQLLLTTMVSADIASGESAGDASALAADTRIRITPTSSAPWKRIARIVFEYPNNTWKICTGFFIGPFTVATAGHCVHDMTRAQPGNIYGWATTATVYPAFDAGATPFGSASGVQLYSTVAWVQNQNPLYDYGAVYLNMPLGDTVGWFDYGFFSDSYLTAFFASGVADIAGYPLDKDASCLGADLNPVHAGCLWDDSGSVSITSTILNYSINTDVDIPGTPPTNAGQDGSPIWINDSGNLYAIGLNLFNMGNPQCSTGKNCGLRITSAVAANFLAWSNKNPLTDPMGAGIYDDTSASWLYTGMWNTFAGTGPYAGTLHYADSNTSAATFTFTGVKFVLFYTGEFNRGSFEVWVDNVYVTTINAYSATTSWQRTYTSPLYPAGVHSVVLKNISARTDVDAIQIIAPMGPGIYDDRHIAWTYTGTWNTYAGAGPYAGTLSYTDEVSAATTFTFNGVQFVLSYTGEFNRGSFEVWVDGVLETTVNAYSATTSWQKKYTSPLYAPGVHVVMIKNNGSGRTDVDAIQVISSMGPGNYDDAHAAWIYGGTWNTYAGTGPYAGTLHYTDAADASATFMFTGIQFVFTYTGEFNRGSFEVWVDDVYVTTINAYSATTSWQKTYASPIYSPDVHIVVFKNLGTGRIDVDAIKVINTQDTLAPSPVENLVAAPGTGNGTLDLNWKAPMNDAGNPLSGPVISYQVRYSTANIVSESDWDAATAITSGIPQPGAVGTTQIMTLTELVPGMGYYISIRGQDIGLNLGPIVTTYSTAKAPARVGPGVYDDNHAAWVYTGVWNMYAGTGPYVSTLHYTDNVNAKAAFVFTGVQFVLTYTADKNRGPFEIWVDGKLVTTVNAYNATTSWQRKYTSPIFASGDHTVVFKNTGSGRTDVDAIQIVAPAGVGIYDDGNASWIYSGTWSTYAGSGPYANTLHYADSSANAATFTFSGVRFVLTYTRDANRGSFEVWVDGALATTVNAYNATTMWQQTYTSPIYSSGVHTVVFKNISGRTDVDAIQIVDALGPGIYDDAYGSWVYTGTWATYTGTGPYANTLHYTDATNATATFLFTGTQFVYIYTGDKNRGPFEIWVDGALAATLNAYSSSTTWQMKYTSPTYASGLHTVMIKRTGTGRVDTDAIQVFGPMRPGTYDDADTAWIYTGTWSTYAGAGPYAGTLHYTDANTASASFTFNGVQFALTYTGEFNRGSFEVWVDGSLVTTVNAYSATTSWQRKYVSPIYAAGDHTVVIKNNGTGRTDIDAIQILGLSGAGMYDDFNTAWLYTSTWNTYTTSTGPYAGTLHYTDVPTATANFVFTGTQFVFSYTGEFNRGSFEVWVDGTYVTTVNAYSSLTSWQRTYVSPIYSSGVHTVVFKNTGSTRIDVDAIQILP